MNQEENTKLYINNKSAQVLAKNLVFHEQNNHIDTRYHFIRQCIVKKEVELVHVKTQDQVVDIFIKPLKTKKQKVVSLSSVEVEFWGMSKELCELL
ncbi:Copia protein, partial [Mucuna pruriens]